MKIEVLFFAACREITGKNRMELELKEGECVSGVLTMLQSDFHDLLTMPIMLAVNAEYVQDDYKP